ncbi:MULTISPECIES: C40 family peptidase [unclassified Flavobacterium]|uniref:C40 family peptidase n=1 Tax=unclassified Flavobacterium TaxID=196869 RepID=UPI003619632B
MYSLIKKVSILTLLFLGISCGNPKYIDEVPLKLKYDENKIKDELGIKETKPNHRLADQYEEGLTDEQIRVKEKYAVLLSVRPDEIKSYDFYEYIDKWLGTPYGNRSFSKDSLAMVPFAQALYSKAYKKSLPRTALGIFKSKDIELFLSRIDLEEGDLIFLRYNKDNPISDVAIYLKNDRILATTKSSGLRIFNFNDDYFQTRYFASGRIKTDDDKTN